MKACRTASMPTTGRATARSPPTTAGSACSPGSRKTASHKEMTMHAARSIVGALFAVAVSAPAGAAIREEPVTYKDGDTTMKGFVVYDDAVKGKRPGIVLVHEWWGITKHMHNEARRFAQNGYTAFIADMHGDAKTADNPNDAVEPAGGVIK